MTQRQIAVSVTNLSKSYRISHNEERHSTLAEAVVQRLKQPFHRTARETFWALKDITFDITEGDVVGIIGRNGAGKSTLLKVLSGITEPTIGEVKLFGRVGSLLEVGTGFHPELTGRENIFLNGAILGMRRTEIQRQFDAIVDFAGVAAFLDTPVKRYSSGMYVRLAFAVAAHLNTEILIVDEVLAVGDMEFQKRCLGKMQDVAHSGRTVIFVSHNMATVNNLCNRCLVLHAGQLCFSGETDDGIQLYMQSNTAADSATRQLTDYRPSWARPWITRARALSLDGHEATTFPLGQSLALEIEFQSPDQSVLRNPVMGVVINHYSYGAVGAVNMRMSAFEIAEGRYGAGTARCVIDRFPFVQGRYTADLWLGDGPVDVDVVNGYLEFEIEEADIYGSGKAPYANMGVGILYPKWEFAGEGIIDG